MKNKSLILGSVVIALVLIVGLVIFIMKKNSTPKTATTENTEIDLPINTIPLSERPFITLSPDSTGRSLDISVSEAPTEGEMEYEMVYNASGKQEGALGFLSLSSETQPIVKAILLGSKSGGGKVTYHEGVTGGSITVTYNDTRLKESWNYLHFDPTDPSISSTDGRFSLTLTKAALKADAVIITMKTFGYSKAGLPEGANVVSGPYGYFTQTPIKGTATVEMKLPAGDHVNPTLYEWTGAAWKKLTAKVEGDTLTAQATGHIFLITTN
jgi:hypothetical protein